MKAGRHGRVRRRGIPQRWVGSAAATLWGGLPESSRQDALRTLSMLAERVIDEDLGRSAP